MVKAVINGSKITCGKCGHKIAECKGLRGVLGTGTIYIMCRHKDKGKVCKEVNEINV